MLGTMKTVHFAIRAVGPTIQAKTIPRTVVVIQRCRSSGRGRTREASVLVAISAVAGTIEAVVHPV